MKETILYISKSEQDIQSFLKYLQSKLEAEHKECTLDEKHDILKVPKYYDIVGKSVHGTMLGAGYGYCKYYCFSEAYSKDNSSSFGRAVDFSAVLILTLKNKCSIIDVSEVVLYGI